MILYVYFRSVLSSTKHNLTSGPCKLTFGMSRLVGHKSYYRHPKCWGAKNHFDAVKSELQSTKWIRTNRQWEDQQMRCGKDRGLGAHHRCHHLRFFAKNREIQRHAHMLRISRFRRRTAASTSTPGSRRCRIQKRLRACGGERNAWTASSRRRVFIATAAVAAVSRVPTLCRGYWRQVTDRCGPPSSEYNMLS